MQSIERAYTLQPKMQAVVDGFEALSDTSAARYVKPVFCG